MKWAGGAGRREGVHMLHTFEEIRTRTPANHSEAALEATMPQAAWEALLRDVVQALRPPHTPETLCQWLHTTNSQAWAIGAPQAPPPTPQQPHREEKGQGQGKGKGSERTARQGGGEKPKVAGRRPQGQGTQGDTTGGQETINGPGRGRTRGRDTEGQAQRGAPGRKHRKGTPQRKASTAPPPANTARPPEPHASQDSPPKHKT